MTLLRWLIVRSAHSHLATKSHNLVIYIHVLMSDAMHNNRTLHPADVPNRPDEMYAPEWVSWEEFLGLMRSYEDTRNLAVNVLGLRTYDDYILFVRGHPKRAEGLRIPVRPDLFYKEEWVDEETFFSRSS